MKVEDHPYAYGWFEGNIGSGYGKGDVIVWDDGWWEPDPEYPDSADPEKAVAKGELKFVLHGKKLRGRYVIVNTGGRTKNRSGSSAKDDDQWLLIHKKDADAVTGWDPEDHPHSVLSNRTNPDVVAGKPGRLGRADQGRVEALDAIHEKGHWTIAGETTLLTNLDKLFMPGRDGEPPIMKRDIVRYYAEIAPWMSPYLAGRPVNFNRFPDGIVGRRRASGTRRCPRTRPTSSAAGRTRARRPARRRDYMLVDGAPALVWAANFAGIEMHPWTSTAANPDQPSYALVDIDPGRRRRGTRR